jgi:capsular polysaccharide export protein
MAPKIRTDSGLKDSSGVILDVTRLIDRLRHRRLPTGIDRVGLAYIEHFGPRSRALVRWGGRAHLLPASESQLLFRWLLKPGSRSALYLLLGVGIFRSLLFPCPRAPWLINTGHGGLDDPLLRKLVERDGARLLVMVHDLIPLTHPAFCRAGEDHRHAARLRMSLTLARGVICNSEATRSELAAWAASMGLTLPPALVAWLAPGITARVARPKPLASPYFVVLGTVEPRKNHALLIKVWTQLRAQLGDQTPKLVVIGQPGWDVDHTLRDLRAGEARGDFVLLLSGCDDDTTAAWLQHAHALLFPSFTEGYGLPLLEALALGVPAIASDLPAFREIGGDLPCYLNPADTAAWAAAITQQLSRPSAESKQAIDFSPPTWRQHFSALEAWMVELHAMPVEGPVYALGFSRWKRAAVRTAFTGRLVYFVKHERQVPEGATLAIWGLPQESLAARADLQLRRLEDGFLRSVGLGAELVRPLSWVVDRRGLYYDATAPSDLEVLLEQADFSPAELARAARFRECVVAAGLTKYNLGGKLWQRPAGVRRVILLLGQVESDASLRYGAPEVNTNLGLARAVRKEAPADFLLYKPHPDVVSRLRASGANEDRVAAVVDAVVVEADLHRLLEVVDEVHVMTSLAGFEALLRGVSVVCHGLPFYAGWGLTRDRCRSPRRSRRLTLDELVAGALLRYPRYFSRDNRSLIAPEQAFDALLAWRDEQTQRGPTWWRPLWRATLRITVGVR